MSSKFITGGGHHCKEAFFFIGGWGGCRYHTSVYNQNHDHESVLLTLFGCCHCCIQKKSTFDKGDNHYQFVKQFPITLHCATNFSVLNNTILHKELFFICSLGLFNGQSHLKMCSYGLYHEENLSYSVVGSGQYYCNFLNTTEEYTSWFPNTHPVPQLTSK